MVASLDCAVEQLILLAELGSGASAAIHALRRAAEEAAPADLDRTIDRLGQDLEAADVRAASRLARCCGALVEGGGRPEIALEPVLERLQETLYLAQVFAETCEEMASEEDDLPARDGEEVGEDEPTRKFGAAVGEQMPLNALAFAAIDDFCMASVAMLARSSFNRKRARLEYPNLVQAAADLAPFHPSAGLVAKILSVLDGEELVVLHPKERKGYLLRMTGIATNFELFVLLADALIGDPGSGWLRGSRPDPALVAMCKSPVTAVRDKHVRAAFNFYNWPALRRDGAVPDTNDYFASKDKIWMEGIPDDIEDFEGQRVVLLGPASNSRSFRREYYFEGLAAELCLEQILSRPAVENWIERLKRAANDRRASSKNAGLRKCEADAIEIG